MFHFSLCDKAKHWLRTVEEGSLTTWDEVTRAFLGKYCPHEKTAELRRKITNFNQEIDETLSEAWERFKDYTRKCRHHGFTSWIIVQSFYDGLTPTSRANLDNGAGGSLEKLSVNDAYKMIEEVTQHYAYGGDRRQPQAKKGRIHDLSAIDLIASKFDMQAYKLDQATLTSLSSSSQQVMSCETCGGNDHLSFLGKETINTLNLTIRRSNADMQANIQQLQAHNKIIENQLAQIAQKVGSLSSNPSGHFLSSTVVNPKEQAKAITLRSGRGYERPIMSEDEPQKRDEGVVVRNEGEFENEIVDVERKKPQKKNEGNEEKVEKPP
ncbi:uncharacterized protein LOC110735278 [Chenopodium quinoa]|uniref:uncharacterized protein LOC110735278 n=1 Tax=Chenopodium quinoa TaxID=63459 RepID=UPI000B7974D0|nr:uncharacterized protein LOC110735278 [Chenopodium quinoa]